MKRSILAAIVLLAIPISADAQTQTLIDTNAEKGGYGGPTLKFMEAGGEFGLLMGGQGAAVWGKKFAVGGGGWGLVTEHIITDPTLNEYKLDFGYGGILFQYMHDPDKLIHWDAEILIAWGSLGFEPTGGGRTEDETVMVFEPAANAMLNVSDNLRVGLGFGYRIVTNMSEDIKTRFGVTESLVDGFSFNVTFRFGKY
jgi:hypothetical protein